MTELRRPAGPGARPRLDIGGAITITAGLSAVVYAIIETSAHPWLSARTLSVLAVAVLLLAASDADACRCRLAIRADAESAV